MPAEIEYRGGKWRVVLVTARRRAVVASYPARFRAQEHADRLNVRPCSICDLTGHDEEECEWLERQP